MKPARYSKIALVTMLSIGIAHGTALAKQKKDDDTSVYNWGPWGKMVTPAAGPTPTLPVTLPTGFTYQPTPTPTPTPTPDGQQFRSYATYRRTTYQSSGYIIEGKYYSNDDYESRNYSRVPAHFQLNMTLGPPEMDDDEAYGEVTAASYRVGPRVAAPDYPDRQSVPMEGEYSQYTDDGLTYTEGYANGDVYSQSENAENSQYSGVDFIQAPWQGDVTGGYWYDGAEGSTTTYGEGGVPIITNSADSGWGVFVQGMTPTLAFMESLAAGNVIGTYEGFTLETGSPVAITMDFGSATWNGIWNNGVDGAWTHTHTDSNNVIWLHGPVGFEAGGTITGVDFASTSVTAANATSISGSVNGSVLGANAEAVGGIVDITKSVDGAEGYQGARYVDVFYADQNGGIEGSGLK